MIRLHLSRSARLHLIHDGAVFLGALVTTGILSADHLTRDVVMAAVITAVKVTVRQLLPVAEPQASTADPAPAQGD